MPPIASLFKRLRSRPEPAPAPGGPVDLLDPDFVQNPYPSLARLRRDEPLHRCAQGAWLVTRSADIQAALQDNRLSNAPAPFALVNPRNRQRYVCADVANNIIPYQDGETHRLTRQYIAKAWINQLREHPPQIQGTARALLQSLADVREIELLSSFATPLAVAVISDILGIPEADRAEAYQDIQWFFYLFTSMPDQATREATDAALSRLREYFDELLEKRRAEPRADLISQFAATLDQAPCSRLAVIDHLLLLFADGVENVDSGIASATALLLLHPEQWQALCADPQTLHKPAAAECLRYESPAMFIGRTALESFTWHGCEIQQGQALLLMLASANHDEALYEQAETFDIHRQRNTHVSFGKGAHSCIGGNLARVTLEETLLVMAEILPTIQLASPQLVWQKRLGHRWLQRLDLRR